MAAKLQRYSDDGGLRLQLSLQWIKLSTWGSLPAPRSNCGVVIYNGGLYVFGGKSAAGTPSGDAVGQLRGLIGVRVLGMLSVQERNP